MLLAACAQREEDPSVNLQHDYFGTVPSGREVRAYALTNGSGMLVRAINYGGIIQSLIVPDRDGTPADIVLGYDSLAPYLDASPYFGAITGRYTNRIGGAKFTLDGTTYQLAANDGPNHLHGGLKGFDKVVWNAETFQTEDGAGVVFTYISPAGEEGYPGTLEARITYTLTSNSELVVDYFGTTDEATPVNLTQHSYFNLAGHDGGDVLDHRLMINADAFTPVGATLIPTGELRSVADTPFDFRQPTAIGARIEDNDEQLRFGLGYDDNFVLNRESAAARSTVLAARVSDPESGRVMEIHTTEPGLQFYTGNHLDGTLRGKGGAVYRHRAGFCLETQHYPDSPNKPDFPTTILRPGMEYRSRTVFVFSVL